MLHPFSHFKSHHTFVTGLLLVAGLLMALPHEGAAQESEQAMKKEAEAASSDTLGDIISELEGEGQFTKLVDALERTGLAMQLRGEEAFTLFAPTDAAFEALPDEKVSALTERQLTRLLRYHVVKGQLQSADVASQDSLVTVQGEGLTIQDNDGQLVVKDGDIVEADIKARNGVIHAVNTVLVPSSMKQTSSQAQKEGEAPKQKR